MSFSFSFSPLLLALCALGAAGLTYWMYRTTTPPLSPGRRWVLGGFRFGALFLILFLLFQPVLRLADRIEKPPALAVLIDDSQSLRVTGGTEDTTASAGAVRTLLDRLRTSGAESDLRFFRFGDDLQALPDEEVGTPDSVHFTRPRTDISNALAGARDALRNENLRGVVLISDGQYNTGRNPLYVAERSGLPIHAIVVGDTARQRDVQIRRVTTNDVAYVGAELPVRVGIRTQDYPDEEVQVALLQDGEELDSTRLRLPDGTAEVPVDLRFEPEAAGLQRLTVAVTQLAGEATYRNNTEAFTVRVLESRRRVLLLGAAPSPDLSAVRQLLEADQDAEAATYVPKAPGTYYEGALPDTLSNFDVLVLAGFPGAAVSEGDVERVAQAVADGLPVLFLLDRQTDLEALQTHFDTLLPAVPERIRSGFTEAVFAPTERGQRHPILDIADAAPILWERLPPLLQSQSRWQASPDALVLATPVVRGVALDDPLLAVRQRTGQRTAALLAAGTWRWKNLPEDLAAADSLWPGLFSNLVQWVSAREDDRPVRVTPTRETFAGSESVQFTGQVYDESLDPVSDASVEVTLADAEGARFPHQMEAIGNGRYQLDLGTLPEGTYRYEALATQEGDSLGTDTGSFAVGALTLEFRETQANTALMRQLAARSGGTFHTPDDAETLLAQLASSEDLVPLVVEEERETRLWQFYGFLLAILALLSAEWFLRKRSGLV